MSIEKGIRVDAYREWREAQKVAWESVDDGRNQNV
jgi:hypothetical protein